MLSAANSRSSKQFRPARFHFAMLASVLFLASIYILGGSARPLQREQVVMGSALSNSFGTGYLSTWSKQCKRDFLAALDRKEAQDYVIVLGNEAGDLDSLVSAMTYAFTLSHANPPQKAVALLQVEEDALDLRPENKLALANSGMSSGHADILTMDDFPGEPDPDNLADVTAAVKGFVLVDHNRLLAHWGKAGEEKVLGIMDHHVDHGSYPNANPRIISPTASCSTIVANEMLKHDLSVKIPAELADLILATIAIDSDDFKHGQDTLDYDVASRIFDKSSYRDEKLHKTMNRLDKELSEAKKDLDLLSVYDLLRRDWKGGLMTSTTTDVEVHLGLASMPYSLKNQIAKAGNITEWFRIETAWTFDIRKFFSAVLSKTDNMTGADVTVALTSFKDEDGNKRREIIFVVKATHRLTHEQAVSLFQHIVKRVEEAKELDVTEWDGDLGESGHKRYVWNNRNPKAGRKIVRPIVEAAIQEWLG